jgi:two-component sensor histidine kinase
MISIMLLYEPPVAKGKPVPVARVANQDLIEAVARAAVQEAQARVESLTAADELLGEVEREEAFRLRRVLELLIPALKSSDPKCSPTIVM